MGISWEFHGNFRGISWDAGGISLMGIEDFNDFNDIYIRGDI
jgi:hypothetical protein